MVDLESKLNALHPDFWAHLLAQASSSAAAPGSVRVWFNRRAGENLRKPSATPEDMTISLVQTPRSVPVELKQLRCCGTPRYTGLPSAPFFHRTLHTPLRPPGTLSTFHLPLPCLH